MEDVKGGVDEVLELEQQPRGWCNDKTLEDFKCKFEEILLNGRIEVGSSNEFTKKEFVNDIPLDNELEFKDKSLIFIKDVVAALANNLDEEYGIELL